MTKYATYEPMGPYNIRRSKFFDSFGEAQEYKMKQGLSGLVEPVDNWQEVINWDLAKGIIFDEDIA